MPNTFLDLYRQQVNDDRPDDVIVLDLAQKLPDLLDKYPDLRADFERIQRAQEALQPTAGDVAKQVVGSIVRGAAGTLASIPEGVATTRAALRELAPDILKPLVKSPLDVVLGPEAADTALRATGQAIRSAGERISPPSLPELEQSFLATRVPQAAGSSAAFLLGGAAGAAAKVPGWIAISTLGAASGVTDFYTDAKSKGADDRTAYLAGLVGGVVGTSEALPLARMLHRLDGIAAGAFTKLLVEAGRDSFEEALQEAGQQWAQNYVAKKWYDKDRSIFQDLKDNAGAGGVTGFLYSILTQAVGRKMGLKHLPGVQPPETTPGTAAPPSGAVTGTTTEQTPPPAGQPVAPAGSAAPAVIPVIPDAAKPFVQDDQGNPPDPELFASLRSFAQEDLAGTLTPDRRDWLERTALPYIRNAYVLVKDQVKQEKAGQTPTPAATQTTTQGGEVIAENQIQTPGQISTEQGIPVEQGTAVQAQVGTAFGGGANQEIIASPTVTPAVTEAIAPTPPPAPVSTSQVPAVPAIAQPATTPAATMATVPTVPAAMDIEPLIARMDLARTQPEFSHRAQHEASFFELEPQPYSFGLATRLTANAQIRKGEGDQRPKVSMTHQLTFFLDNDTGQVLGAGTYKDSKTEFVGRLPGNKTGQRLDNFMKSGRYVPLGSMTLNQRVNAIDPSHVIRFADQAQYQKFADAAKERLAGELAKQTALETPVQITATGEPVTNVTPATELADKEGFTEDEAAAIWEATRSVKAADLKSAINQQLQKDPDLFHAIKVLLQVFLDHGITSRYEATQTLFQFIEDAKATAFGSKGKFTQALSTAVGEAIRRDFQPTGPGLVPTLNEPGPAAIQAQPTLPATTPTGGPAGTIPGPAGGTETGGQGGSPGQAAVRFHRGPLKDRYRPAPHQVAAQFQGAVTALANAGYTVQLVQQEAARMQEELGQLDNANQVVTLIMGNTAAPTTTNLYHLNAEVAHAVYADLTEAEQERLQEAVRFVTDEMLGAPAAGTPLIAPGVPAAQRASVGAEERLVDIAARRITQQGFDATQAQGLAERFWRFLRQLYYRTALALHRAWFGQDLGTRGAELAAGYLQTRVESFLAGNIRPMSFVDYMGGATPRPEQANNWFTLAAGHSAVSFRWNTETGRIEVQPVLAETATAALFNMTNATVRYHGPRGRNAPAQAAPDIGPEVIIGDIASSNELSDRLHDLFVNWQNVQGANIGTTGQPLTTEAQFRAKLLRGTTLQEPGELIAQLNQSVQQLGQAAQDPNTRMATLNPAAQRDVANKTLQKINKLFASWATAYQQSAYERSGEPGSERRKFDRNVLRLQNLTKNYANLELLFEDARTSLRGWVNWLRSNAVNIGGLAHKEGLLEQIVREIEGRIDEPLAKQYADTIDSLAKRFAENAASKFSFMNVLRHLADTDIPWHQMSVAEIRDAIRNSTYPELASGILDPLRAHTHEGNGLMTVAVAFVKREDLMMAMLGLSAAKSDNNRAAVNNALQIALSDQKDAARMARNTLNAQNRTHARGLRVLAELERVKAEQRTLLDHLEQHASWMTFYEGAKPLFSGQAAIYERVIGAVDENFEPYPGAEMLVVENANEPPDTIIARERRVYSPERDGAADAELRVQLRLIDQWLEANGQGTPHYGGNVFNRLTAQISKIRENDVQADFNRGTRSFIQNFIGPIVTKLEYMGLPVTKQLARQFRAYGSMHYEIRELEQRMANRWSVAASKARKELGFRRQQMDRFLEQYYDAAWNYIERRTDLQFVAATDEQAFENKLQAVRGYFNLPAKHWSALEELLRVTADNSTAVAKFYELHGGKIADDDAHIWRSYRGPKGEVQRTLNGTIDRVHNEMAGKTGPWAKAPPDPKTISAAYTADRTTLRAQLAPLFFADVWKHFVSPLARRSGFAVFKAAPDASGFARLATVAEATQAFDQSAPGDIVGFAENLFSLTGGQPAGTAAAADFVAETIGTVRNWFDWIHEMHQEQSRITGQTMAPVQQLMMDARKTNEIPPEWLRYRRFDIHSTRSLMNQLSFHLAFGRNLEPAEKLVSSAANYFQRIENKLKDEVIRPVETVAAGKNRAQLRSLLEGRAKALGYTLEQMENASKHLHTLQYEWTNFQAFVRQHGGVSMEFRPWAELLSTAVTLVVQGPKTAFFDTSSLYKPLQMFGAGRIGAGYTIEALKMTGREVAAGFMETFGLAVKNECDEIKLLHEFNLMPAGDQYDLKSRVITAALGYPQTEGAGLMARIGRGLAVTSRVLREIVNTPLPSLTKPADRKFLRVRPALFTYGSQAMHLGSIAATWRVFNKLTTEAAQWLNNPAQFKELNDPRFRFNKDHSRVLGYNVDEFQRVISLLAQNGLNLETMAKDFIARGMTGRALDDKTYRRLMVLGPTELMQESSILTRPSALATNPVWHLATPLIGWSIMQTASFDQSTRQLITGERETAAKAIKRGLSAFIPIVGVSLAYSLLADWWDEEVLHKKSNRLSLTGDNLALAVIDRMSLIGTLGIAGEVANGYLNVSTARDISIDSRVFFVNSLQQIYRATSTWLRQGEASYSTVGRPLFMALGGSGALQYLQAFNGILGLDNAESRVTARINVNNWLRVAGRELNLPVRVAGRGSAADAVANRTTPWIREMALAALANDSVEFADAYREAILAAREDHRLDPKDYVRRAYSYQHPLRSVFATAPSERDYRLLLNALPENGRRDVAEALRLINRYGQRLDIEPYYGEPSPVSAGPTRNDLLRREASAFTVKSALGL